jgi:hypothetical protein
MLIGTMTAPALMSDSQFPSTQLLHIPNNDYVLEAAS